jgi:hypothetical protein
MPNNRCKLECFFGDQDQNQHFDGLHSGKVEGTDTPTIIVNLLWPQNFFEVQTHNELMKLALDAN